MIGHFVGVAMEFPVKYSCELLTQTSTHGYDLNSTSLEVTNQCDVNEQWYKQFSSISCTAASKVTHEVVEFLVNLAITAWGVKNTFNYFEKTLDYFGMNHKCDHGWWWPIIGATGGIVVEYLYDQNNIFANAAIGYGASLATSLLAEELFHRCLPGEHSHGHSHSHGD